MNRKMNIQKLYYRSVNIITSSSKEWKLIREENLSIRELKKQVLYPYAILIGIFTFFGTLFNNLHSPVFSSLYLLINALIEFGIIYFTTVISSWIAFRMAVNLDESNRHRSCFALVTYSSVPFFILLAITRLFPPLLFILVASAFSVLVFWRGIDILLRIPSDRKRQYLIITLLLTVTVYVVFSQIMTLLYSALTKEFSTFGN